MKGYLYLIITLLLLPAAWQPTSPKLATLLVELWPEYDRPETLVIYRGELTTDTPLPAQLSFLLPSHIDTIHAVAIEQNGQLFQIDQAAIQLTTGGDHSILTFSVTNRAFQFEYYDPRLLTIQNQRRQLNFRFGTPFDIEQTTIEVQQPLQADDFAVSPTPNRTLTDNNGLTYHLLDLAGLQLGEAFSVNATYLRNTDEPSMQLLGLLPATPATDAASPRAWLGYLMIGLGFVLLLGSGYWWFSTHQAAEGLATVSVGQTKKSAGNLKVTRTADTTGFCHRCGAALRREAKFCHVCGTARRQ